MISYFELFRFIEYAKKMYYYEGSLIGNGRKAI